MITGRVPDERESGHALVGARHHVENASASIPSMQRTSGTSTPAERAVLAAAYAERAMICSNPAFRCRSGTRLAIDRRPLRDAQKYSASAPTCTLIGVSAD